MEEIGLMEDLRAQNRIFGNVIVQVVVLNLILKGEFWWKHMPIEPLGGRKFSSTTPFGLSSFLSKF